MMNTQTVKPWTRIPTYNSTVDMTTALLDFNADTCKKCDICTFICPARSIVRNTDNKAWNGGLPFLKSLAPGITGCIACGCCIASCPAGAISVTRNFRPGGYYKRLTQTEELYWPKAYQPGDSKTPMSVTPGADENKTPDAADDPKITLSQSLRYKLNTLMWIKRGILGFSSFLAHQFRHKRGMKTLKKFMKSEPFDISWARLLEESTAKVPDKTCLLYNDESLTYKEMDQNANRLGNYLASLGLGKGDGLGIIMRNSPRFLDAFFGTQKIGMYSVPVNPELKGDGLVYIINHSDVKTLMVDAELLLPVLSNIDRLDNITLDKIIVNDVEQEAQGIDFPKECKRLSQAYTLSADNPRIEYRPDDICLIIYTSGTTGPPKGVVYRYNNSGVLLLSLGGRIFFSKNDIYYTYLALCHGNALFVTVTMSLSARCTIALSRKFSASRFWDAINKHRATVFNTIGSIIPILMKQPERPDDSKNTVTHVSSSACPADMWEAFEKRFGVTLYETYGAIDGGGKGIMNLGTAPKGSLGKPPKTAGARIVDENGREVPVGVPGELVFGIRSKGTLVEYYKSPEATQKKNKGGWLHTGDIIRKDRKGYYYFVGRNTESMRKGGENVSAYEVEHVIMQHPAVEDVAVYAVPSDLSEDDIMASVTLVDGQTLDPKKLHAFLLDKLAKYAVPRYIRIVSEFKKTNTHRIIKKELEDEGVTADTFDAKKV